MAICKIYVKDRDEKFVEAVYLLYIAVDRFFIWVYNTWSSVKTVTIKHIYIFLGGCCYRDRFGRAICPRLFHFALRGMRVYRNWPIRPKFTER